MTKEFTTKFFHWAKNNSYDYAKIASELGNNASTVKNWNSIGVPKGKEYACQALMDKYESDKSSQSIDPSQTVIKCYPTEEQRNEWDEAGLLDGDDFNEFMISRINKLAASINSIDDLNIEPLTNLVNFRYHGQMAAGQPAEMAVQETIEVKSNLSPENHIVLEVCGQSGEPKFMDGDKWFICTNRRGYTAKKNVPAVFEDENGMYLKVYQGNDKPFASVNPNSPDLYPGENLKLVGYPVEKVER